MSECSEDAPVDGTEPALYAAYGSNLDSEDLARWCDEAGQSMSMSVPESVAWLPDRRPAFTAFGARRNGGVLDALPTIGAVLPCALYRVDREAIAALDAKESRGTLYRRVETVALDDDMAAKRIFTYEILPDRRSAFVRPHDDYVAVVRRGLLQHRHVPDALDAAERDDPQCGLLTRIFVYGTLLPGESRHHVLREHGLRACEPASVAGTLIDVGRFPGLVPTTDGTSRVHGVVATVDDIPGLLRRLDRIEGFRGWSDDGLSCTPAASLFWRRLARATPTDDTVASDRSDELDRKVRPVGGPSVLTWIYRLAGAAEGAKIIHSGRWVDR